MSLTAAQPQWLTKTTQDVKQYLKNGLSEIYSMVQQAVEVVPLLLQGSQILLQLGPGLLIPHGEELSADL